MLNLKSKNKKIRLLIVSQGFWPETFPINDIIDALNKDKFKIDVLTGKPNYPSGKIFPGYKLFGISEQTKKEKYTITRVPIIPRGAGSPIKIIINYISFILSGIIFGSWALKSKKFDVILVFAPSPIFQALVGIYFKLTKKTKLITWVQDLWPDVLYETGYLKNRFLLSIIKYFVKFIYRKNDLILAQSKSFEKQIKKLSNQVPVMYFPNPAKKFINKKSINERYLKKGKKFNIIFAGNLGKAQSIETILKTAVLLKNKPRIIFTIVGDGRMYNWTKNEIKQKKIHNVFLTGRLKKNKLSNIFKSCSALLITLKNGYVLNKTIPSKLQTYLSVGKPIIGSLNGEASKIIKTSKAGTVSSAEKPIMLMKNIIKMQKMSKKRLNQMGKNGIFYYKNNFQLNLLTIKLEKIIKNLI